MGSIKWKLVLLYILLVVFVIVVSGVYIIMSVQRNQYRDTYTELEYTSDRIVDTLQTASLEEESDIQAVFAEVLSALMLESVNLDAKNIYLLDQNGKLCLENARLVAYNHGEYYLLGEKLGFFGYSVAKEDVIKRRMGKDKK